jgi:RNA polymerase sigma-70 factor, ECF subfamily
VLIDIAVDRSATKGSEATSITRPFQPIDEELLLSKAQSGDDDAFCALVEPYLRRIFLTAAKITRNHEDAEDVSQECLVKAFTHIRTFRRDAKFSTWLVRITINESLMRVRKRKSEFKHVLTESDVSDIPSVFQMRDLKKSSDPEAVWMQTERDEILRDAVGQLGEQSKLAIHLFQTGEMPTREIGNALRMSHYEMKACLRRAMRKLRSALADSLGDGEEGIRGWV